MTPDEIRGLTGTALAAAVAENAEQARVIHRLRLKQTRPPTGDHR